MSTSQSDSTGRVHRHAAVVILGSLFLGCSGDGATEPPTPSNDPAAIEISAPSLRLLVGNAFTLEADVRTSDGRSAAAAVQWSTNAASVVSVDAAGRLEALSGGQAIVTATAGSVSGRATVTVPLPAGQVSQAGGYVETPTKGVQLTVPANSVSTAVDISVQEALTDSVPSGTDVLAGTVFEFGPAGLHFAQPAMLSIAYEPTTVTNSQERRLRLHKLVAAAWVPVTGSTVDREKHTVSGEISSFSIYGIVPGPNQAAVVQITSPADGSRHDLASAVAFVGEAQDAEDGTLPGTSLAWASDVDGALGTGQTLTRSDLTLGAHVVTLTATDSDGAQGSVSVSVTIIDPPPTAQIIAPADNTVAKIGHSVTFEGSGSDPVEGALTGSSLSWSSSVDGALGTGEALTTTSLSEAVHLIYLRATNSRGGSAVDSISLTVAPNATPSVTITSPDDGEGFAQGRQVHFEGSASDLEDGSLSGNALTWTSSLDGTLGHGTSLNRSDLSIGQHTVMLAAVDADGGSSEASVSVTVFGVPAVVITTPAPGTATNFGTSTEFAGAGTDPEDGALTGSALVWTSNHDGQIGTGVGFSSSSLSSGSHRITLTATDSDGWQGSAAVAISVKPPAPGLVAPAPGAVLDNGCSSGTDPIAWDFDWDDVAGADRYHIYVRGATASIPFIDDEVSGSSYHKGSTGYIGDSNRQGWTWRVRARARGVWGPWSAERTFDAEPLNTDCPAPILLSPAPQAVLDNGCSIAADPINWGFDWADVAGASRYHISIIGPGASTPLVNDGSVTASSFQYAGSGYIIDSNRLGWTWRVRALLGGAWTAWGEVRVFNVEPLNSDCGGY